MWFSALGFSGVSMSGKSHVKHPMRQPLPPQIAHTQDFNDLRRIPLLLSQKISKMPYSRGRQWLRLAQSWQASLATKNLPTVWLFTYHKTPIRSPLQDPREESSSLRGLKAFRGLKKTTQKPVKEQTLWPHSNGSESLLSLFVNSSQKGWGMALIGKKVHVLRQWEPRCCLQIVQSPTHWLSLAF